MTQEKFYVSGCYAEVFEFTYEEGEKEYVNGYAMEDIKGIFTLDKLLEQFRYYGFSTNPKDYMFWAENGYSELMSDCMQNSEGGNPSDSELELWKKGKEKLFIVRFSAHIQIVTVEDMTKEQAEKIGFDTNC